MSKYIKLALLVIGAIGVAGFYYGASLSQWVEAQTQSAKNRSTVTRELYVYLTKGSYDGNLGGLEGANAKCEQDRPDSVPAGLKYKAYLAADKSVLLGGSYVRNQKPAVDWNTIVYGANDGNTGYMYTFCGGCAASKVLINALNMALANPIHPRYEDGRSPTGGSSDDLSYGLAGIYRSSRRLSVGTGPGREAYKTSEGLGLDVAPFWSWGASPCRSERYTTNYTSLTNCSGAKNLQSPFTFDGGGTAARNVWDLASQSAFTTSRGVNFNACKTWTSNDAADTTFTGNTGHDFSWDSTDFSYSGKEADGYYLYIDGLSNEDGHPFTQVNQGREYPSNNMRAATWSRDRVASCAEKNRILCFAQPQ